MLLLQIYGVVSSAKLQMSIFLSVKNKLCKSMLNNKSLSADHCRTPLIKSVQELVVLFIFTLWFLFDK